MHLRAKCAVLKCAEPLKAVVCLAKDSVYTVLPRIASDSVCEHAADHNKTASAV